MSPNPDCTGEPRQLSSTLRMTLEYMVIVVPLAICKKKNEK
jgi:hypothetical protein